MRKKHGSTRKRATAKPSRRSETKKRTTTTAGLEPRSRRGKVRRQGKPALERTRHAIIKGRTSAHRGQKIRRKGIDRKRQFEKSLDLASRRLQSRFGRISIGAKVRRKRIDRKKQIENSLDLASRRLQSRFGHVSIVNVVRNADGSVDGELRLPNRLGKNQHEALLDLNEALTAPKDKNVWLSVGTRFVPDKLIDQIVTNEERDRYDAVFGLINIGAYFQRATRKEFNVRAALDNSDRAAEIFKQNANEIYVRMHYDRSHKQPERVGHKIKKRKANRGRRGER